MVKKFSIPRGTRDILPDEVLLWRETESIAHRILQIYGYSEIRTPFFEETDLFSRSMGQTSDVVQKQMLNLATVGPLEKDYSDRLNFSLRPEGTASIVRSYIENDFAKKESLTKFYYIGPMFRGERPQKGRLRQFHQIGVEALGPYSDSPYLDAEVISLSVHLLTALGLKGFQLKINSLGSAEDKEKFSTILRDCFRRNLSSLCPDCQQRFERNVFRILDCKNKKCREIIRRLDILGSYLSKGSQEYFDKVKEALTKVNIPFEVSPHLVRGLDYYTHTVFEISHKSLGSQDAVGAGGRFNNLVKDLGGDPQGVIGAIGFALGTERILLAKSEKEASGVSQLDVFIIPMDAKFFEKAFFLLNDIRNSGVPCDMNYHGGSMKSQMRLANKLGARYVMILGEDEIKKNTITLKNMQSGAQKEINLGKIKKELLDSLNEKG